MTSFGGITEKSLHLVISTFSGDILIVEKFENAVVFGLLMNVAKLSANLNDSTAPSVKTASDTTKWGV